MGAPERQPAGLGRRIAAMFYDALLSGAILFFAGVVFQAAIREPLSEWQRHLFQVYLFLVLGLYFTWCWQRGGQTLAMKTWKLRLERLDGGSVTIKQALIRYALAWISLMVIGAGYLWALFDRDRQFLHDRLARTKVVVYP